MAPPKNQLAAIVGTQFGHEGKGKFVELFAKRIDIIARCAGGDKEERHIQVSDQTFTFNLLPPGIVHPNITVLIGNGCIVHLPTLFREIELNEARGCHDVKDRVKISDKCHLIFDFHRRLDQFQESERIKIGEALQTPRRGIGPCYSAKCNRFGLRISDLIGFYDNFREKYTRLCSHYMQAYPLWIDIDGDLSMYKRYAEELTPMVVESVSYLNLQLRNYKRIMVECPSSSMLDIDHGTYPFVMAQGCNVGVVLSGLGVPPRRVGNTIGVTKTYTTRTGNGPLPTEQKNLIGEHFQFVGKEIDKVTGNKRRCGWLDMCMLRYTKLMNEFDALILTKMDVLDSLEEVKIAVEYRRPNGEKVVVFPSSDADLSELTVGYITLPGWKTKLGGIRKYAELPTNAKKLIEKIEELLMCPVWYISVGADRNAVIERDQSDNVREDSMLAGDKFCNDYCLCC